VAQDRFMNLKNVQILVKIFVLCVIVF